MSEIKAKIKEHKIIPIIAIEKMDDVLPLADSLIEGGLPLIEITFRTKIAPEVIKLLHKERPEMLLGAGTVLTNDELKAAIDNGAAFGVAPGFNPKIVEGALKNNFLFMPGILTPTDLEAALSLGINVFKFFPAEAAGGINYLKSISAPYSHKNIQFIPTGGINIQNLRDYLDLKEVLAVGGTWLAKKADIETGQWDMIVKKCRAAKDLGSGTRNLD
jgi:2-dehydro-3-deoxyphosphogluconate aldolase/(4S)-4-hydroxy-2-oxoglutarate aldolase